MGEACLGILRRRTGAGTRRVRAGRDARGPMFLAPLPSHADPDSFWRPLPERMSSLGASAFTRPGFRYGGFDSGPRASLPAVFLSVPWHVMPELWSGCGWVKPVRGYFDVGPEREPDGYVRAGMPADQCSSHHCLLTLIRTVSGAHYPSACPPCEPALTRPRFRYGGFRTGPRASVPMCPN